MYPPKETFKGDDTSSMQFHRRTPAGLTSLTLLLILVFSSSPLLQADTAENFGHISAGFTRVLGAGFQIPGYMIHKTLSGPIGLGTVDGVLSGTYHAVRELSVGALQMAQGAAPYAKYLAFL